MAEDMHNIDKYINFQKIFIFDGWGTQHFSKLTTASALKDQFWWSLNSIVPSVWPRTRTLSLEISEATAVRDISK